MNEADIAPPSLLDNIENLWILVHRHSPEAFQRRNIGSADSTTKLVISGWVKIKEAQFQAAQTKANNSESRIDRKIGSASPTTGNSLEDVHKMRDERNDGDTENFENGKATPRNLLSRKGRIRQSGEHASETTQSRNGLGIEGLSFDTVPNVNITAELRSIAEGLCSPSTEGDFYTTQVNYNRGWKLLLLGLVQAESLNRYLAMCALKIAVPVINDTLLDYSTRENLLLVLVNLMQSDERRENRLKAIYLIGVISFQLGFVREHDDMLLRVFKELMKILIDIQFKERKLPLEERKMFQNETRSLKVYLIHAIGKFSSNLNQNSRYMEDLTLYALHNEFDGGDSKIEVNACVNKKELTHRVLIHDIKHTEQNEKYIGSIFKAYVAPLLKITTQGIQTAAVQFVGNWLPVTNEDNRILALDTLQAGLSYTRDLGIESFRKEEYDMELLAFKQKILAEESRLALRSKLLRQLLLVPGTYASLPPVTDHPGFFANNDTSMFNSKAIAVGLPIHPKSNVLVARPIPNIPGVPSSCTAIPPVFMARKTPGLPIGYTYFPSRPVDVYSQRGIERPKKTADTLPKHPGAMISAANNDDIEEGDSSTSGFGFVKRRGTMIRADFKAKNPAEIDYPIPSGTSKQLPRESDLVLGSALKSDGRNTKFIPAGFQSICPFPGFDPDASLGDQEKSAIFAQDDMRETEDDSKYPFGCTTGKFPVLWPSKRTNLKNIVKLDDFMMFSPVLFLIVQPGSSSFQQILCQVVGVDKDVSAVSVQHHLDSNLMSAGATFNLFVRNRSNKFCWKCINLQVIDEDYREGTLLSAKRKSSNDIRSAAGVQAVSDSIHQKGNASVGSPIAAGVTLTGDPYFSPPANIPPMPVGYTSDMMPYYGKTATVKPQPLGVTIDGVRFYDPSGSLSDTTRNPVGGYDNCGQPFYIPKGCLLPTPAGYTSDGIAFFDIPAILNQKGTMLLPEKRQKNWTDFDIEDDDVVEYQDIRPDGTCITKKLDSDALLNDLLINLKVTQAEVAKTVLSERTKKLGTVRRLKEYTQNVASLFTDSWDVSDPDDVMKYLKMSGPVSMKAANTVKVQMDPTTLEFQSVHAAVSKSVVMRYRTNRGDLDEKDFFLSVEPLEIFSIPIFHVKLQGEGMISVEVTFNPIAANLNRVDGILSLIDESGNKLVSCTLIGLCQSFIKIVPNFIDAGWMLPEKRKESSIKIENLSSISISLTLELSSEANAKAAVATATALLRKGDINASVSEKAMEEMNRKGFILSTRTVKLQPLESKNISVYFEPTNLGRYVDGIEITAPGGDLIRVPLNGAAGIPIVIYPESRENSQAGSLSLTPERAEFMNKFKKVISEKNHTPLSDVDVSILQNMMSANADFASRKIAHTIDFGICYSAVSAEVMRCVTIMNLSNFPISIGLYPHISAIRCKYFLKIPPRSAISVEVVLNLAECQKGILTTAIEVVCPEFQNIPLFVQGFIGQPIYFNSWDIAYFRPCPAGVSDTINITIINESQYDIEFTLTGLDSNERNDENISCFDCQFSDDESRMNKIIGLNAYPISFKFAARQRGPWMKSIGFKLSKKFGGFELPGCPSGNKLSLVGICIEPWSHIPGTSPDKNGLEMLRLWMSHPKRVSDEYSILQCEREKRFGLIKFDGTCKQRELIEDLEAIMSSDDVIFRQNPRNSQEDQMAGRRTQVQSLLSKNNSAAALPMIWIASTQFSIEPQEKLVRFGAEQQTDILFIPPNEMVDNVTIFGFAAVVSDNSHKYHAIHTYCKPYLDFLLFPPCGQDGNVVLDFGRIETTTSLFDINTKWLMMVNSYSHSYSWSLKFLSPKSKFNPFEAEINFGEIEAKDSFPLSFTFRSDTSGFFECAVEITIKHAIDRSTKPIRMPNIILRAHSIITAVSGFPEMIDFGSTLAFQRRKKTFTLLNSGTVETKVSLHCRSPFSVSPKSFEFAPKGTQEITVTFAPTESKCSVSTILIFANQKLSIVPVSGSGGTADLICEMYGSKNVDFGVQKEGSIAWTSVYLTNKGTLPLLLSSVAAGRPELIKVEYCGITSTIPYGGMQSAKNMVAVKKNFWAILKRKLAIFLFLKGMQGSAMSWRKKMKGKRKDTFIDISGLAIPVLDMMSDVESSNIQNLYSIVPELRPFYSYHFRLGYLCKYQPHKDTNLQVRYLPVTTQDENTIGSIKTMSIMVTGSVFRSLEILPSSLDFGITPVEIFVDSWKKSVAQHKEKTDEKFYNLSVLNMSFEAQNMTLEYIAPEFKISGKTWTVNPGEKILIPVEFHPPKEQTQYNGEVLFKNNGTDHVVIVTGTGATADVVADDHVDFGSVKLGSISHQKLRICNRGLLDCRFMLEIMQKGNEFRFLEDEPYEYDGVLPSGSVELVDIECSCESVLSGKVHIALRWQKVPYGVWEAVDIPLVVQTGVPVFKLSSLELDFKTTYINVNKTLEFAVSNDGNASCYWAVESSSPVLKISPESGTIPFGTTTSVKVTFIPKDFEQLVAEVTFFTDAGRKSLMCYGLVGVPYLVVPSEFLNLDFGVSAIEKPQSKAITITNSGSKPIVYEIIVQNMLENGIRTDSQFEIFFVNPANGTLQPGCSQTVNIQAIPKSYGSTVTANFVINTKDGERYVGDLKVTGGRAIIKIAPPTYSLNESSEDSRTAEISKEERQQFAEAKNIALFEMQRLAFQTHIENLRDVLSGLRTEGIEQMEQNTSRFKPESKSQIKGGGADLQAPTTGRVMTPVRPDGVVQSSSLSPRKKKDLLALQKAEALIQSKILAAEAKRQTASATTFDGSDLKAKVQKALELAYSRGYKKDRSRPLSEPESAPNKPKTNAIEQFRAITAATSNPSDNNDYKSSLDASVRSDRPDAENFLEELASLESDLEVLSAVIKSIDSSSGTPTPASSRSSNLSRYQAGSPNKTPREATSRSWRTPRSRGIRDNIQNVVREKENPKFKKLVEIMHGSSQSDNQEVAASANNESRKTAKSVKEDTSSGGSATATSINSGESSTGREDTSQEYSKSAAIEDLVSVAYFYTSLMNTEKNLEIKAEIMEEINSQMISSTKGVIKLVKDQLASSWVPNREFLSSTLKQVQQSSNVIEILKKSKSTPKADSVNDFSLGLVRAGEKLSNVKLFNLPNMGNIALDFNIKINDQIKLRPEGFLESEEAELFSMVPTEGVLEPQTALNFSISFMARAPGFYQQAFDLESGGETVMSFSVTAMSGIPLIQLEPKSVDFGLVSRNKYDFRSVVISNAGSFKDIWRLERVKSRGFDDQEEENETFFPSILEGLLDPRQSVTVDIKFAPKVEGNYTRLYRVIWTGEPCSLDVKGIGGGARLKYELPAEDASFGCLNWGVTVVGKVYSKTFTVKNTGNVEGFFRVEHPNVLFRIDQPSKGIFRIDPGSSVEIQIHISPIYSETINDSVMISLLDDASVIKIPSTLVSGTKIWAIDGSADFKNMSIRDSQKVELSVLNAGTLEIPLEYILNLEDAEMSDFMKLDVSQEPHKTTTTSTKAAPKNCIMLKPSQLVNVIASITPKKEHRRIIGQVILKTELGSGPEMVTFPFDFWTYDKQISLDDSKDVSVGRVLVGETASIERTLTNFGSEQVKFRLRIESVDTTPSSLDLSAESDQIELKGGKKRPPQKIKRKVASLKKIPWKIREMAEGILEANKAIDLHVDFESLDDNGDDWQEARLVIERHNSESDVWTELSSVKLVGAAGTPKLSISDEEVDFGVTGIGVSGVKMLSLTNEGNALLMYEFETGWDYNGNLWFEDENLLKGSIPPGDSKTISLVFKPDQAQEYLTPLTIKTQLETKIIVLKGTGASFKFFREGLPPVLNFGSIAIGDSLTKEITIRNDCIYSIAVEATVFKENPAFEVNQSEYYEFVTVDPKVLEIAANQSKNPEELSRSASILSVTVRTPDIFRSRMGVDELDVENLLFFCGNATKKNYLQLSTIGGNPETGIGIIPTTFNFHVHQLVSISSSKLSSLKKGEILESSEIISELDFGEVGYESGGSMSVVLYNRNLFKVEVSAVVSREECFLVFPPKAIIHPHDAKEFRIEMKPMDVENSDEIASSLKCTDILKICSPISLFSDVCISIVGYYIDEPDDLDLSKPIDFGVVRRHFTGTQCLEFRNPVRRSLKYSFTIDNNYKDIFCLQHGASSLSGIAKPRAHVEIPITFQPKLGTAYSAECTLETDDQNFLIVLKGVGVDPSLFISEENVNFGIVGVGAAEFKTISIKNSSKISARFSFKLNNPIFKISEESAGEIKLETSETHSLKIICNPTEVGQFSQDTVDIINLDIPPGQKKFSSFGRINLEATGGTCAFQFSKNEEDNGEEGDTEKSDTENEKADIPTIFVNFAKIIQGQRVRKHFEIENCGDTLIDLVITDTKGTEAGENYELVSEKTAFSFSPAAVIIKPHSKQKFSVIARGLRVGEDVYRVQIKTKSHMDARIIPVRIKTKVLSPDSQLGESLKVFARADNSIDGILAVKSPQKISENPDLDLWKIFIPVIRVGLEMPSEELDFVPCVEPNTSVPDISSCVIRPPAVPKEIVQKTKKWYANRTSMALDQTRVVTPKTDQRRKDALEWVRPVEKQKNENQMFHPRLAMIRPLPVPAFRQFGLQGMAPQSSTLQARFVSYVGLRPRRMAHKKMQKGFFKEHSGGSLRGTSLLFGNYGLRVIEGGRLQDKQIDAARTVMRRVVKEEKGANFHLKCFTDRPVTCKPAEVRMGKGKGAVEFFATWVPKGRIIFEISCSRRETGLNALRVAAAAIPLRTEVVESGNMAEKKGEYRPALGVTPPRCLPHFIKKRLADEEFRAKIESRRAARSVVDGHVEKDRALV
ncbi:hypothetical protein HDU83_006556 [Entophlyctis luteolus]|nr:hypothetical protein HDU83_006556 [Entophlyctis luteolus]